MESSFRIDYQCPQCGAPVVIEETDRLFTCGFCRVRVVFNPGAGFRYCLPVADHIPRGEIFYVPFWRFKGMYFNCVPYEVKGKIMDTTLTAVDLDFMPPNLGYRMQTHSLRMASASLGAGFLAPLKEQQGVMDRVQGQTHHVAVLTREAKSLFSAYVGEVMSLIYNPVYIRNQAIYDGIVNRPLGRYSVERQPVFEEAPASPGWEFGFVSALCPACGWDLEGERDSVVLFCRNCETAWRMVGGGFQRVSFGVLAGSSGRDYLLPFWDMRFTFEGVTLDTYADLVRLTNLPRVVQPAWETRELHLWLPAFRVAPSHYRRLSQKLTVLQSEPELSISLPRNGVHPATLGAEEAAEGVRIILGSISVAKRRVLPRLSEMEPRLESARLTYLPFQDRGRDFYHRETNTNLPRNAFRGHTPAS